MEPDMLTKTFKEVAYKDFPYLLKDIRFWSMLAPGSGESTVKNGAVLLIIE